MEFLTWDYVSFSLRIHLGIFISVYSFIYFVYYVWKPSSVQTYKLTMNKYPQNKLVLKEIRRSLVSVLISVAMDFGVMYCLDKNLFGLRGRLTNSFTDLSPLSTNSYLPPVEELFGFDSLWITAVLVFWSDFHFYWMHRALHEVPYLYKHVHKVHHESYNPEPFSGLSFHPLESFFYFSAMFSFALIRMPIYVYHLHRLTLILAPVGGHNAHAYPWAKYEKGKNRPWWHFGDPVDHWIHHTKFNYNFGSGLLPYNG